uniref:Uncharacterized protein n=1 Tax=Caenorhabditis japonica TaxID=281687 RepID=A0A8R1IR80_CAEJA
MDPALLAFFKPAEMASTQRREVSATSSITGKLGEDVRVLHSFLASFLSSFASLSHMDLTRQFRAEFCVLNPIQLSI